MALARSIPPCLSHQIRRSITSSSPQSPTGSTFLLPKENRRLYRIKIQVHSIEKVQVRSSCYATKPPRSGVYADAHGFTAGGREREERRAGAVGASAAAEPGAGPDVRAGALAILPHVDGWGVSTWQPQLQLLEDGRARSSAGTSTSGSSSSSSTSPPQSTSLPPQKDPPGLCAPSHTPEDRCAPGHSTQQPQAEGSGGYLWWHSRPPLSKEEESEYVLSVKAWRALVDVKEGLAAQLGRPPADSEWARAADVSILRLHAVGGRGRAAQRHIVQANMRMVHAIARRYSRSGVPVEDLVQEGIEAIRYGTLKFNPARGAKLSSYCFRWIQHYMAQAVYQRAEFVSLSTHFWHLHRTVLKHSQAFEVSNGRQPSLEELSTCSGLHEQQILLVMSASQPVRSLDSTSCGSSGGSSSNSSPDDGAQRAHDVVPSPSSSAAKPWQLLRDETMRRDLEAALARLTLKEQQVIRIKYGLDDGRQKSAQEVSDYFGNTRQAVEDRAKMALRKLRDSSSLQEYMSAPTTASTGSTL